MPQAKLDDTIDTWKQEEQIKEGFFSAPDTFSVNKSTQEKLGLTQKRDTSLSFRTSTKLKEEIEKAAEKDCRGTSNFIERIVADRLFGSKTATISNKSLYSNMNDTGSDYEAQGRIDRAIYMLKGISDLVVKNVHGDTGDLDNVSALGFSYLLDLIREDLTRVTVHLQKD